MEFARPVAALPVRRERDGSVQVLLVTSRETAGWVIPKGWPWHNCEDCVPAAQGAREKAGVLGRVRLRAWFTLEDAANVVSDSELRGLLQAFGNRGPL
jgi:8-oxo-dGTP pyrophosphatase MutT (NUDIX family)